MAAPYRCASAGAEGNFASRTWIPWNDTERAVRSTTVTALSSTTPKVASLDPSGSTETAAWARISYPSQESSCGWNTV